MGEASTRLCSNPARVICSCHGNEWGDRCCRDSVDLAVDLEAVDHGPNVHAAVRLKQRAKKAGRPRTGKSSMAEVIAAARAFNLATAGSSGESSAAQVERPTAVPTSDRDAGIVVRAAFKWILRVRRKSAEGDAYKKPQDHFFDRQHPPHQVSAIATAAKLGVAYGTMYAKVYIRGNQEWSGLSKHTENFAQRPRVAVVDKAGADKKAEHSIAADQAGVKACQTDPIPLPSR
eukprot:5437239-Amphidinium_carterae.5